MPEQIDDVRKHEKDNEHLHLKPPFLPEKGIKNRQFIVMPGTIHSGASLKNNHNRKYLRGWGFELKTLFQNDYPVLSENIYSFFTQTSA